MLLDEHGIGSGEVTVILNPRAGLGRNPNLQNRIRAAFEVHGWTVRIELVSRDAAPDSLAKEAVSRGDRILIAAGGDGTISGVASA
jgi:diacylglycerol kinase family enzyme